MRKILLLLSAVFTGLFAVAQDCSDLFISEYVEGWYNNKSLEIYNPTQNAITLDDQYRLIRWDNGKTTSDQDPLYVLPLTGSIASFGVMVIVQDTTKPGQDTMVWPELRKKATWLAPYDYGGTTPGGNCVFWNGDDAVSLQKKQNNGSWKDIDIFGEIGVRPLDWQGGTTGAWTDTKPYWRGTGAYLTKDQTLIRRHNIKVGIDRVRMSHYGDSVTGGYPNSFYAFAEYDSMPANFFDSLGFHRCDCKTSSGTGEPVSAKILTVQPNPVTNGQFTITSNREIGSVELYTLVGQRVFQHQYKARLRQIQVKTSQFPAGIYMVRVTLSGNQTEVVKVVIR